MSNKVKAMLLVLLVLVMCLAGCGKKNRKNVSDTLKPDVRAFDQCLTCGNVLLDCFGEKTVVQYRDLIRRFSTVGAKEFTENKFKEAVAYCKNNFGTFQERKFLAFQRFDQRDIVEYLVFCSKNKVVRVSLEFEKDGKLDVFRIAPVQLNQEEKAPAEKAKK